MTNEQFAAVLSNIAGRLQRAVDGVEAELIDTYHVLAEETAGPFERTVLVAPVLDDLRDEISWINDMVQQVRPPQLIPRAGGEQR